MEANSLRQSSSAYYKVVKSTDVPTTSKNPQAEAKCERIHQQVGNVLRTLLHGQQLPHEPGTRTENASLMKHHPLHRMQCAPEHIPPWEVSPGSLVFNRDLFL